MSETPPENGPTIEDFAAAMRKATTEGMKDYDKEREEWESAVAEQERLKKEAENDNPPKKSGGFGEFLLGGKRTASS